MSTQPRPYTPEWKALFAAQADHSKDPALIPDLKRRAADIPADHIRVFVEFLAHNAEKFGLLPDHPDCADALNALFCTFIPHIQEWDAFNSEAHFHDIVNAIKQWNADPYDGARDGAEKCMDLSLRILIPPGRPPKAVA